MRQSQHREKSNKKGFTLAELLVVVAVIAVLVAISIPIFTAQLEKSREATDLANVRAAYSEVMNAAMSDDHSGSTAHYESGLYYQTVNLKQKVSGWQTTKPDPLVIGGVAANDSAHWFGVPGVNGTCTVYYSDNAYTTAAGNSVSGGAAIEWNGGTAGGSSSTSPTIAGLGQKLSRLGSSWSADNTTGLMSVGAASSAESASRVSLTTTPIALSNGATVTIDNASGYKTGYFLIKYDAEAGGFVKVKDSGWLTGTTSFTVDGDGYYLVTNTATTSGTNLTVADAEENVKLEIANNKAISTEGMTGTAVTAVSGSTSGIGYLKNTISSKT